MRAIIIQDADAKALLDQLKLGKFQADYDGWDKKLVRDIHRQFHCLVCRWLQDQGATVT